MPCGFKGWPSSLGGKDGADGFLDGFELTLEKLAHVNDTSKIRGADRKSVV